MPGLGTTFGRGGATNAQWDLANAQCVVIQGSNMAENHPITFRFVMQAKQRGATVIHVDPRFSRTSALADIHAAIRPGTDIAWVGALINHVLTHDRFFKEYVVNYTNASAIITDDFRDTEDLAGVFSGLDRAARQYQPKSWQYEGQPVPAPGYNPVQNSSMEHTPATEGLAEQPPPRDLTLQHPRCVFQLLKRHYARYTPAMVEQVCGVPAELFLRVAEAITHNSGRERTTAWCYAVGWTQHTDGVQMIRAAAVLQLLLGNIGRPGGGIIALRGHASIQGATDIPTLYDMLPTYLGQPSAAKDHETLAGYLQSEYSPTGWWAHYPKYIVSLLKAWYGDHAREENEYAFHHLPRITGDHSQQALTMAIADGALQGLFLIGQNPAVGGHNTAVVRRGLAQLDWLVVRDAYETETASFWYASPEARRGELRAADIKTEIFLLPAALSLEKEGSFTNTHRLLQWHDKAIDPPGDARSEPWFVYHLGRRLRELYAADPDQQAPRVRQLLDLTWDYPLEGAHDEPVVEAILQEINGYHVSDRRPVRNFTELCDDGATACGGWLYSGVMPETGINLARNRKPDPPTGPGVHLDWGFAWPADRRILYNRAAADPAGRPWSEAKRYVWWDADVGRWTGHDVPDFPREKPPHYQPDWASHPRGLEAHPGTAPFIMMPDGLGWLYAPSGLQDGPLPAHYEPVESPVRNLLYPEQQFSPVAKLFERSDNRYHRVGDPAYPYVLTTYRLTEHHTGGLMSRAVPWLAELQPDGFIELSPELAAAHGVGDGDWVTLTTARGAVEARALVTHRLRPLHLDGRAVHVIGMPFHYGYAGLAQGDIANTLSAMVGEPNISIHEGKAFTCQLRAGRKGEA